MSVTVMAQVWLLDLPAARKLVLLALADHADDDGLCWPAQKTIARKCGISDRQVRNHVSALMEAGLLRVEKRRMLETTIWRVTTGRKVPVSAETSFQSVRKSTSDKPSQENHHKEPPSSLPVERQRNEAWDALVALFGDPLPSARSMYGRAAKELNDAGATQAEIVVRSQRLVEAWGPNKLTVTSLLKHWSRFGAPAGVLTGDKVKEHQTASALEAFRNGGDQ